MSTEEASDDPTGAIVKGYMDMKGIIDMHNHTLYGVDDGAKSVEQSQRMIDIAYDEGIRGIILTPHHNPYRWRNDMDTLRNRHKQLEMYCDEHYKDFKLYLGCELFYGEDTLEDLVSGKAPTMAGGRYVLAEFAPMVTYSVIRQAIMDLQQAGYNPIIAHIERYLCIYDDDSYVDDLKELGAFIQINAGSVLGEHGRLEKKLVRRMLRYGQVDFVATDAHRDDSRMPRIKKCASYIEKHYGEEYAYKIFVDNPNKIIEDEYIEE